ncbi:hypothetical protein ELS19_01410 [Halogeometricum borinquense]|uniref:Uncharacterized protein n=1 Tax=Halogeometricum borinquense TaxID=60847 RepID=A0A482TBS7_9EURY|nr:hypothetical protein [Halogeometricum borinquense]RYJ12758.1 hypothetical protein ELS19_01410 [Halogeometricum borinquense]
MGQATFRLDDEVEEWIENRLVAGQAKSVWYRYAVESTIQVDPILDELYEKYQYEERQELIESAVRKEVDRRKRD